MAVAAIPSSSTTADANRAPTPLPPPTDYYVTIVNEAVIAPFAAKKSPQRCRHCRHHHQYYYASAPAVTIVTTNALAVATPPTSPTYFLDASSHLYNRLCLSVRWSVGPLRLFKNRVSQLFLATVRSYTELNDRYTCFERLL